MTRAVTLALAMLLSSGTLRAENVSSADLYRSGITALERGAFDEAVDQFELLSDRGFVHADASYNRALSYMGRAQGTGARPGDLGRAAAALEEVLQLRPDDVEATFALERLRSEISRRRARAGADPVVVKPALLRAVVGLLDERLYAAVAALGSVVLSVSLALRLLVTHARVRLAGTIAAAVGAALLLVFGGLAALAQSLRKNADPAVVVVSEARLLDERGTPIASNKLEHVAVPEGASVFVSVRQGRLARIEWGNVRGWVPLSDLRILSRP